MRKKIPQNLRLVTEEMLRLLFMEHDITDFDSPMQLLQNKGNESRTSRLWIDC